MEEEEALEFQEHSALPALKPGKNPIDPAIHSTSKRNAGEQHYAESSSAAGRPALAGSPQLPGLGGPGGPTWVRASAELTGPV